MERALRHMGSLGVKKKKKSDSLYIHAPTVLSESLVLRINSTHTGWVQRLEKCSCDRKVV